MARRVRAYVGLGANVGDARANLVNAARALAALPRVTLRGVSPLYRTRPVGVKNQPDFLNAVAALDVPSGPDPETGALALLVALKELESALGRRPRQRWGPREVDLDLLVFGRHAISVERPDGRWPEVPHPAARERLFVLAPLGDLAPGLRPPRWKATVESTRRRVTRSQAAGAVELVAEWDASQRQWHARPRLLPE
ncbi:2-amino-4-hydroxy-6-hydroxymethyldihydropteridinediphosphokinase [soil metagenome]